MRESLLFYSDEMAKELDEILSYWATYTVDNEHGGFYGKVDNENEADRKAAKGVVLNSRILWAFSAAYNHTKRNELLILAKRAYDYLEKYFFDREFGGVYWSVDYEGKMLNGRKQIYGLAFCLYGLSEYFKATENPDVLKHAIDLFELIEQHSFDENRKGYFEAFDRNWKPLDDLRLSEKDANEKKTMNTHLHIIEAYANLYEIWKNDFLKTQIESLIEVFSKYLINDKTGNLILFFDEQWNPKSNIISYGHNIEAAWLLLQCAEKIKQQHCIQEMTKASIRITEEASKGLDVDGGLWYEYDISSDHLIREKHSWPQAEAMIGLMNAYQISGEEKYLNKSIQSWQFVKQYIKDKKNGEWFWGVNADYSIMKDQDKVGFWKCPYHDTRACLEIIKRISTLAFA
jgi:mannobiose 2-epimerase